MRSRHERAAQTRLVAQPDAVPRNICLFSRVVLVKAGGELSYRDSQRFPASHMRMKMRRRIQTHLLRRKVR